MRNEIRGVDVVNNMLWQARQQFPDQATWEGTGIKHAGFTTHVDFKAALSYFLTSYPETDCIQGILDDEYRIAVPRNSAAITILDAIAKELGK